MRLVKSIQVLDQQREKRKAKTKKQQDLMKMTTYITKLLMTKEI